MSTMVLVNALGRTKGLFDFLSRRHKAKVNECRDSNSGYSVPLEEVHKLKWKEEQVDPNGTEWVNDIIN